MEQRETGIQQSALSACVGRQIAIHRETRENQEWQSPKQNYKECAPVVVSCLCPFGEMLVSVVSVGACSWVSSWVTRWDDSGIAIDEKTSRWQEKQNSKPKDKLEFQAPPPLFFTQLHSRGLTLRSMQIPLLFAGLQGKAPQRHLHIDVYWRTIHVPKLWNQPSNHRGMIKCDIDDVRP